MQSHYLHLHLHFSTITAHLLYRCNIYLQTQSCTDSAFPHMILQRPPMILYKPHALAYLFYTNNGNSTSTIFYTRPALHPATLHSFNSFLQTSWYSIMLTMNYKTYDSSAHSTTSTDVSPHGIHHNFFSHYQISQPNNSTNFSHNPSQPAFAKHTPGASAQNSTHHME